MPARHSAWRCILRPTCRPGRSSAHCPRMTLSSRAPQGRRNSGPWDAEGAQTGPVTGPVSFGGPTPLQKARLLRSLARRFTGNFESRSRRIAAEKCRGEAHLFAPPPFAVLFPPSTNPHRLDCCAAQSMSPRGDLRPSRRTAADTGSCLSNAEGPAGCDEACGQRTRKPTSCIECGLNGRADGLACEITVPT